MVLREYLHGLGVEVELRAEDGFALESVVNPPPDPEHAVARVWVRIERARASVFIVDSDWQRIFIRHVPLESGFDEVAQEQLATIVHASVESLLAGGEIGVHRQRAAATLGIPLAREREPGPEPEAVATPPEEPAVFEEPTIAGAKHRPLGVDLAVGYGVTLWSMRLAPSSGPRLDARLRIRSPSRPKLDGLVGLRGSYATPLRASNEALEVRMQSVDARAAGGMWWAPRPRFAARMELDVGMTSNHAVSRAVGPDAVAARDDWHFLPASGVELGLAWRVAPSLWLGAAARVDGTWVGIRYRVSDTGDVLFAPWRVRPGVVLELRWSPLGTRRAEP
ncbi:MAG: hypothetical protein AAF799_20355 [Myxococcota bacterium]